MSRKWLIAAASGAVLFGCIGPSAAAPNLNGTDWSADDCDFDFIQFKAHGAAEVVAVGDDDEYYVDAKWTLQGTHVHLTIPAWSESFDGDLTDDALAGTATTRDKKAGTTKVSCHFGKLD